ncbi:hypothetical protein NAT51_15295 [Flavobacterium amniphilum]|uniref:hypothetical protein n=1 Tax=Flavobacterium amniphilum TaxID=1834035 RepID=UPI00202A5B79|nr:hypothetical protein [Flavobacterium amniphilum]MCL9806900.1 hypothetical protein [Flavobacterium amniphilum]
MVEINKINGAKIISIIKIALENILLELYFNVECLNEKFSFKLGIGDDGETVLFSLNTRLIALEEIVYEAYLTTEIEKDKDELSCLLGNEILNIQFGVGETLDTHKKVIYYIKIDTGENEFLFFNNGNDGAYSFDKIEAILEDDIYGYEWLSKPPIDLLE